MSSVNTYLHNLHNHNDDNNLAINRNKSTPQVYWMKDGERLNPDESMNVIVLKEGPLVIEFVEESDEGMYTCVAENSAGTRSSQQVMLTVRGLFLICLYS